MTLAERIERVLHFAAISSEECPPELLDDVTGIKVQYSALKQVLDFESAGRQAKTEWLQEVLGQEYERIHDYRDSLEDK